MAGVKVDIQVITLTMTAYWGSDVLVIFVYSVLESMFLNAADCISLRATHNHHSLQKSSASFMGLANHKTDEQMLEKKIP